MRVDLIYYKPTGTFYSSGSYETNLDQLYEIHYEVERMLRTRTCPGLMSGHSTFLVGVDVPDHPNNHPKLIIDHEALGWEVK